MPQWPSQQAHPGADEYGRSTVWYHAARGDEAALSLDLAAGLDPTAADKDGYSSLHVAAQNGHCEVMKVLLDAGADANTTDRHGNGPLWTACYEGAKDAALPDQQLIIAYLLKAGADPAQKNNAGRSPSFWREISARVDAVFGQAGR